MAGCRCPAGTVLLELGVPQGQVVSRRKGGERIFKEALDSMRGTSFTGYLKVVLSREGEISEGLIAFLQGAPALSLYVFQPLGAEEAWFFGVKAAGYLWADSERPEAVVSLHQAAGLSDLGVLFPQARLSAVEAPVPLPPGQLREDKLSSADPAYSGESFRRSLGRLAPANRRRAEKQAQDVYDLILRFHQNSASGSAPACPECGGALDHLGHCVACPSEDDALPRLDPRLTFETFVPGPGSRFAEAAARAVAGDPGRLYNPLYVHGRSGLGKTHLLQAIGHALAGEGRRAAYLPLAALEDPLVLFTSPEGGLEEADVLLLDDLQFLAGKDRLQEEVLRVLDLLLARGGQAVVSGDRPLRTVPGLSDRLTSRLESGLAVEVAAPDAAARRTILQRVAAERGVEIAPEVLAFAAEACPGNVRQLEGGLNRLIAFAALMRTEVDLELAQEVLGGEGGLPELRERRSYLVEEARPELAYALLNAQLDRGFRALVFSRSNPAAVRERLAGRDAEVYWLTDRESAGERTVPPSLEKIMLQVESFLRGEGASVVLLDDLHYLISNSTFEGVIRLVRTVVDQVTEGRSIFLLSVAPDALSVQERSVLEREMEPLRR